jgi:hypothetical protein
MFNMVNKRSRVNVYVSQHVCPAKFGNLPFMHCLSKINQVLWLLYQVILSTARGYRLRIADASRQLLAVKSVFFMQILLNNMATEDEIIAKRWFVERDCWLIFK